MNSSGRCPPLVGDILKSVVQLRMHNVRFYNLPPVAIKCMAYNENTKKLALNRGDKSIEIWDVGFLPCLEYIIPLCEKNLEALVWCNDRLLSGCSEGQLNEWDLEHLCVKSEMNVVGDGVFCIAVDKENTKLVAGTQGGYMTAYNVADNQLQYLHMFDIQDDDILSCKFSHDGELVVTGSINVVRLFDYKSGQVIARMPIRRMRPADTARVWSVAILDDMTVVAADSTGQLSFFEGRKGIHLQSLKLSGTDILTVDVSEDNQVVCSGIEPIVRIFQRTHKKIGKRKINCWVKVLQRAADTHDVLNLLCIGKNIYSTGISGYLVVSSLKKDQSLIAKHGPFLKNPCFTTCPSKHLIMLRYRNYLQVWRLNNLPSMDRKTIESLLGMESYVNSIPVNNFPKPLLTIKSRNRSSILCSAISDDGKYICYSTNLKTLLIKFELRGDRATLTPFESTTLAEEKASHVAFHADRLFIVNSFTKKITIYKLLDNADQDIEICQIINVTRIVKRGVKLFTITKDGKYFGIVTHRNIASVWQRDENNSYKFLVSAPQNEAAISAFAIQSLTKKLLVAYTNNNFVEYDLEEIYNAKWIKCNFNNDLHCITTILVHPKDHTLYYTHNDKYLYVLERRSSMDDLPRLPQIKRRKNHRSANNNSQNSSSLTLSFKSPFCHLVCIDWLKPDELVVAIIEPLQLLEGLPNAYQTKRFGES